MMVKYCIWGGIVIGQRQWLPTASFRFSWTSRMGCNNLKCGECGHPVRHAVGLCIPTVKKDRLPLPERIEDWALLPYVHPSDGRLYVCHCSASSFSSANPARPTENSWDYEYGLGRLGWHCGGHPTPKVPIIIDGISVERGWALEELVKQILSGKNPAQIDDTAQRVMSFDRAMWLVDLYHILPEFWSKQVAEMVNRFLDADDLSIRAAALSFYHDLPKLNRPAAKYKPLFHGHRDPLGQYYDLGDLWVRTMG